MKTKRLLAALVFAAVLHGRDASAMGILEFARMALDDQSTFVSQMTLNAAKILRAQGHPDQAEKLIALFKDSSKTGGVNQLAVITKQLAQENLRNEDNPNNRVRTYEVEDAMERTLAANGFKVSARDLLAADLTFVPKLPPRY